MDLDVGGGLEVERGPDALAVGEAQHALLDLELVAAELRDPNIDFASDFSSYTNRLEPMARFSSHLVNDKLDLKVLEGLTTRRYRGVVSYQLSDALSTRLQLDNEKPQVGTDFGVDLHLKWEGD
jgi:hypothetical protein